jgi:hypothetical protein
MTKSIPARFCSRQTTKQCVISYYLTIARANSKTTEPSIAKRPTTEAKPRCRASGPRCVQRSSVKVSGSTKNTAKPLGLMRRTYAAFFGGGRTAKWHSAGCYDLAANERTIVCREPRALRQSALGVSIKLQDRVIAELIFAVWFCVRIRSSRIYQPRRRPASRRRRSLRVNKMTSKTLRQP